MEAHVALTAAFSLSLLLGLLSLILLLTEGSGQARWPANQAQSYYGQKNSY